MFRELGDLFRTSFSSHSKRTARPIRQPLSAKPCVEGLEARFLLSGSPVSNIVHLQSIDTINSETAVSTVVVIPSPETGRDVGAGVSDGTSVTPIQVGQAVLELGGVFTAPIRLARAPNSLRQDSSANPESAAMQAIASRPLTLELVSHPRVWAALSFSNGSSRVLGIEEPVPQLGSDSTVPRTTVLSIAQNPGQTVLTLNRERNEQALMARMEPRQPLAEGNAVEVAQAFSGWANGAETADVTARVGSFFLPQPALQLADARGDSTPLAEQGSASFDPAVLALVVLGSFLPETSPNHLLKSARASQLGSRSNPHKSGVKVDQG